MPPPPRHAPATPPSRRARRQRPLWKTSQKEFDLIVDVNVRGVFITMKVRVSQYLFGPDSDRDLSGSTPTSPLPHRGSSPLPAPSAPPDHWGHRLRGSKVSYLYSVLCVYREPKLLWSSSYQVITITVTSPATMPIMWFPALTLLGGGFPAPPPPIRLRLLLYLHDEY